MAMAGGADNSGVVFIYDEAGSRCEQYGGHWQYAKGKGGPGDKNYICVGAHSGREGSKRLRGVSAIAAGTPFVPGGKFAQALGVGVGFGVTYAC